MIGPRLLYFISEDWDFCSHRLPLALAAQDAGYDVAVVTHVNARGEAISKANIGLIPFNLSRGSMDEQTEFSSRSLDRLPPDYQACYIW